MIKQNQEEHQMELEFKKQLQTQFDDNRREKQQLDSKVEQLRNLVTNLTQSKEEEVKKAEKIKGDLEKTDRENLKLQNAVKELEHKIELHTKGEENGKNIFIFDFSRRASCTRETIIKRIENTT
jgi:hypothetical protein